MNNEPQESNEVPARELKPKAGYDWDNVNQILFDTEVDDFVEARALDENK